MVGKKLLEFRGDVEYFTSDDIVAADDSSQGNNSAFFHVFLSKCSKHNSTGIQARQYKG